MIKVSVMYPNKDGARFDHEYYKNKHMPLVKARMGDACKYYTVDKGLAGGAPDAPATYIGMCHIFTDSVEAFQKGFGPHAKEIMGDIKNYTDIAPVIWPSRPWRGPCGMALARPTWRCASEGTSSRCLLRAPRGRRRWRSASGSVHWWWDRASKG